MSSPPPCTFSRQVGVADVDWLQHKMSARDCTLTLRPLSTMRTCLAGRTLTFIGDSAMRDLAMATASLLAGVSVAAAEERSLGQPNWRPDVWEAHHPARAGIMQALLNESARSKKTDGSRGTYTDARHGWTVRALHDLPRAVHWPDIQRIARSKPATSKYGGVSFVQLAIHDTNPKISEMGSGSMRWKRDPLESWTHGAVFQPFLDHWCAVEGEGPRGRVPPPSPLVWVSANEQCKAKKPRKWRYQAELITAANRASAEAARQTGVPMLDWSRLYVNETETCKGTTDGVPTAQSKRACTEHIPRRALKMHSSPRARSLALRGRFIIVNGLTTCVQPSSSHTFATPRVASRRRRVGSALPSTQARRGALISE